MPSDAPHPDDFYPRMIALCIGCAISFMRDYEAEPKRRIALAQRMARTLVAMVKKGTGDD